MVQAEGAGKVPNTGIQGRSATLANVLYLPCHNNKYSNRSYIKTASRFQTARDIFSLSQSLQKVHVELSFFL